MRADPVDKSRVLDLLRRRVEADLADLESSQRATQGEAIHEETRQEDPKDTRAIEATYLARGLAGRVEGLRDALATLRAFEPVSGQREIGVGSLVVLERSDDGEVRTCVLVPVAGGPALDVDGGSVQPVTLTSPLGQALIGRAEGDDVRVVTPGGPVEYVVVGVS